MTIVNNNPFLILFKIIGVVNIILRQYDSPQWREIYNLLIISPKFRLYQQANTDIEHLRIA